MSEKLLMVLFQTEFIEVPAGCTCILIFVQFQTKKWTVSIDGKISMVILNLFHRNYES